MSTARNGCLACGSGRFRLVRYDNHLNTKWLKNVIKDTLAVCDWISGGANPALHRRAMFMGHCIKLCCDCGYGVLDKSRISSDDLREYYRSLYWQAGGPKDADQLSEDVARDSRSEGQLAFVRDVIANIKNFRMLEIGAAAANFSRRLRGDIPYANIEVVEMGQGWLPYYKQLNIKHAADFYPAKLPTAYGYIHTSHWLEHVVPDITSILKSLHSHLDIGGYLFVEVPSCDSDYWQHDFGDKPHIHFFTESALKFLLEKHGFSCVSSVVCGVTSREHFDTIRKGHPGQYEPSLSDEIERSERGNIRREGGTNLRALFRKV